MVRVFIRRWTKRDFQEKDFSEKTESKNKAKKGWAGS